MFAHGAVSLAAMLPWPLLGILLLSSQFDKPSEACIFFGGVTLFPLMILALFGSVPEEALLAIILVVWLAAAFAPWILLRRFLDSRGAIIGMLALQAVFSIAQAAMGALLVIGKSV
jgi:general stress protein CsbA